MTPETESEQVDRVAYEAAIAQRNHYRERSERLQSELATVRAERDALLTEWLIVHGEATRFDDLSERTRLVLAAPPEDEPAKAPGEAE